MKFSIFLISILAFTNWLAAQESQIQFDPGEFTLLNDDLNSISPVPFAESITVEDLRQHLSVLASDEFEGRETGTSGNKKAAEYIAKQFQKFGIPPVGDDSSYYQNVSFTWSQWEKVEIHVGDKRYRHLWDFISFPTRNSNFPIIEASEVLFLGYGIDDPAYSDYAGVDVQDKVILVYKNEPVSRSGLSYLTGKPTLSEWSTDWRKKLKAAKDHGVKAILFIESNLQREINNNRRFLVGSRLTMGNEEDPSLNYANSAYISTTIARALMGKRFRKVVKARKKIAKKGVPQKVLLETDLKIMQEKSERRVIGENILGYIEGVDDSLKHEVLIITAHYDHLGKRGDDIYNGADDNGSGTSTVLEVCQAFAEAKKFGIGPRRSILTMLVTGEEKGLLGSQYYTKYPKYPLENTIANVNVDMVGRVDKKYKDNPNYIYVIGSDRLSTELHEINEKANASYTKLTLDYTYNREDDPNRYYYRSDHYNFAEKGIPAIFYFNGTHADYHRTSDTVEKINFEKMQTIAQLVFYTSWELANRDERIKLDVQKDN